jgi:hypothetical protein
LSFFILNVLALRGKMAFLSFMTPKAANADADADLL